METNKGGVVEPKKIDGVNVEMTLDYKGSSRTIHDTVPNVSTHEDYLKQYILLWNCIKK